LGDKKEGMDNKTSASHSATLPDLLIRYKNSAGEETEREIRQVRVPVPKFIYAACQLEQAERAFKISRIKSAVDVSTGEVIKDLYAFLGVTRPKSSHPESLPFTTAEIKSRRKK
jgi:predicted DNA-binding transcriptional regulator YafY